LPHRRIIKRWPWKRMVVSIREMTAAGGRCLLWAQRIHEAIGGTIIHIVPDPTKVPGASAIGALRMKDGKLISESFAEHFAVRFGDRMYDRITGPGGLSIGEYMKLFEHADALRFTPWKRGSGHA